MTTVTNIYREPGSGFGTWLALVFLAMFTVLLAGCNNDADSTGSGEIVIGLTDAEGDLATYTVNVLSLTLTRNDGIIVETLPLNTRIDFAQYTEMTEFLTAATVPSGTYTSASMTLDYSSADIQAEDPSGNNVPVTDIQDIDGNPVTTLEVSVQLEGQDRLFIAPGIPAHMTLDFDLEASNDVDFSGPAPVLTVAPFLAADVELETPKPHRLRGPLASVDVDDDTFSLILRPFRHVLAEDNRRFGTLDVHVDGDTVYEINGDGYQGDPGLTELAAQPRLTAVIAIGELERINERRRFVASQVYAGSSVPHGTDDAVTGHVIARTGNTLQLKGATLLRADGSALFNDTVTIELAPTTVVTKQLSPGSHDIDEISVGQHLTAFGTVSGDAISGYILDASNGLARMQLTTVSGAVVQQDSPLAIDLDRIGRRPEALFDFNGTGVDVANDADPAFYEINTGSLGLAAIAPGDPVKVRGFPRSFGMAPEDFDALTLIDVAEARAFMTVNWVPPSATAIAALDDSSITLDLAGSGRFHTVVRAGVLTDLTTLVNAPVLVPGDPDRGVYAISHNHSAQVFLDFAGFSAVLSGQLDAGRAVKSVLATGSFDDTTAIMTVRRLRVVLR